MIKSHYIESVELINAQGRAPAFPHRELGLIYAYEILPADRARDEGVLEFYQQQAPSSGRQVNSCVRCHLNDKAREQLIL